MVQWAGGKVDTTRTLHVRVGAAKRRRSSSMDPGTSVFLFKPLDKRVGLVRTIDCPANSRLRQIIVNTGFVLTVKVSL